MRAAARERLQRLFSCRRYHALSSADQGGRGCHCRMYSRRVRAEQRDQAPASALAGKHAALDFGWPFLRAGDKWVSAARLRRRRSREAVTRLLDLACLVPFSAVKFLDCNPIKLNHSAPMKPYFLLLLCVVFVCPSPISWLLLPTTAPTRQKEEAEACIKMVASGFLKIADTRDQRFEGKVSETTALCRGGPKAVQFRMTPWVDWSQYFGTGDKSSAAARVSHGEGRNI